MIQSQVKELVDQKFGGADKVNLSEVQRATGLTYVTVSKWYKGRIDRVDFPTLATWCKYLECKPGDILRLEETT